MVLSRTAAAWLVAGAALLSDEAAYAQMYVCTTASGRDIRSDQPPRECADREIRELRPDGSIRRVIKPPPTPEERRKLEEEEKRKYDEEDRLRSQQRSDKSLLETYATLEEIEAARKRALADQHVILERVNQRKDEIKRERLKLDNEAEFYLKRDMPEKLKRDFAANNESMKTQDKMIADTKGAIARVNERFDTYSRRFRELVERGATPVQRTAEDKIR